MAYSLGTIRQFKTKQFRVIVDAIPESDLDLSWDETGETTRKLQEGEYVAFTARARVIHETLGELGSDYLGNCIYESLGDFQDHRQCAQETRKLRESGSNAVCGSYFADMVSIAIREARKEIKSLQQIHIREAE